MTRRKSVPRDLLRNASDEQAKTDGCYFDPKAVERVTTFIETFCCHTKSRWFGKPFRLLAWQKDIVRRVYGWKRPDGTRRFRLVYIEIPKKNGKSEFLSTLVLYHLIADGEMAAEIYLCAFTRKQAAIIFEDAKMMIDASPHLTKALTYKDSFHEKTITFPPTRSVLTVMSSDAPSADGKSSSFTSFDELHRQEKPDLWNVMKHAGAARPQPLLFAITTAGVDRLSVCYAQRSYSQKVADGIVIDTAFLGVVFAADPEKDDLDSPKTWKKANPSWGETISPEDFAQEHARAKEDPIEWHNFIRLRLNVWTQDVCRFLDMGKWRRCGEEKYDAEELVKQTAYLGIDLSNVSDITAAVFLVPWEDGTLRVAPHFWIPRDYAAQRQERDRIPYLDWARRGFITLTDGDVIDYDFVKKTIMEECDKYDVRKVLLDPFNATQIGLQLAAEGLPVEYMRQGFLSMNAPTKFLSKVVSEGSLRHNANPVLDWMADNAVAKEDAEGLVKVSKGRSKDKVDGLVALIMCLAAYTRDVHPEPNIY